MIIVGLFFASVVIYFCANSNLKIWFEYILLVFSNLTEIQSQFFEIISIFDGLSRNHLHLEPRHWALVYWRASIEILSHKLGVSQNYKYPFSWLTLVTLQLIEFQTLESRVDISNTGSVMQNFSVFMLYQDSYWNYSICIFEIKSATDQNQMNIQRVRKQHRWWC